jgi:hypothetical protein
MAFADLGDTAWHLHQVPRRALGSKTSPPRYAPGR